MSNAYRIDSVQVISHGEQVAYVLTPSGGYLVGSIPDAVAEPDARDAGIIGKADSYEEAVATWRKSYRLD